MHVVVIQTAFLGDLILSTPLLKQLRGAGASKISLVARKGLGKLLLDLNLVDHLYEIEKGNESTYKSAAEAFQGQPVDHLICPHESFRSGRLARKIPTIGKKVAYGSWWGRFIFDETLPKPMKYPDALRQLSLLTLIDSEFEKTWMNSNLKALESSETVDAPVDFRKTPIPDWASMDVSERVPESKVQEEAPIALLAPGSVWNTKKWTKEGFCQTARNLLEAGYSVKLIGSQAEFEICEHVRAGNENIENRAGQDSLMGSLALMKQSSVLVSNDSGAMHLASLVNLPTVTVFGPTVLSLGYRPWNQNAVAVQVDLNCRPCGKHGHKKCPLGTHECMVSLPSSEVIAAVRALQ